MYRVLLPIDDDESRARAQAEVIRDLPAATEEIRVDVLHVYDEVTTTDAEWAAGGFAETFAEEMDEQARDRRLPGAVEDATDVLESESVEYTVRETGGEPPEQILAAADEFDVDLVVLGVGERSPVGKVLFGSVVQAVILGSERPVTVVSAA